MVNYKKIYTVYLGVKMKKSFCKLTALVAVLLFAFNNHCFAAQMPPSDFYATSGAGVNTAITTEDVSPIKVNIGSDLTLSTGLSTPSDATIYYEGFGHTINGNAKKGIENLGTRYSYVNNLTLDNFKNTHNEITITFDPLILDFNYGGALYNEGNAYIYNSTFSNNEVSGTPGSTADETMGMGGAIYSTKSLNIYDSRFNVNSSDGNAGAIYAKGDLLSISGSTFNGNITGLSGGAVYSQATTTNISGSTFTNNRANQWGVLYIEGNTANVSHSTFENNQAGIGGAIYNASGTLLTISDSIFNTNISSWSGGAIYNRYAKSAQIYNSTFTGNTSTDYHGGAIFNASGKVVISNSTFDSNRARFGGAIYNDDNLFSVVTIYDSIFKSNNATKDSGGNYGNGGAIWNDGSIYIIANNRDVLFQNNSSTDKGGAIYNSGIDHPATSTSAILNLVANTSGIEFTGNTADLGNDIYNAGTLNLNSGIGDITFNSGIHSENPININGQILADLNNDGTIGTAEYAPTTGRVVLNSALSGMGNVTVNGGMLQVGASGSIGASGTNKSIGDLTLAGNSILNLANGEANDTIYANNLKIIGTPSIWMDADLNNNTSDKMSAALSGAGTPSFIFRILNDYSSGGNSITVGNNSLSGLSSTAYTNGYKYDFTGNTSGGFDYTQSSITNGYDSALADNTHNRSLSLVMGNITSLGTGSVSDNTLTIFGTGTEATDFAISGGANALKTSNKRLLDIGANGTVYIDEAIFRNGYNFAGGPISNAGNLYIYDSLITGNYSRNNGGAIVNNGTTYVSGTTFSNNKTFGTTFMGGAVSNAAGKSFVAYNSDFNNNNAHLGGAIYNNGNLTVSDSRFTDNSATQDAWYSEGGAIYNVSGNAKIYGSTFTNNIASSRGGAISNKDSGLLTVYNSNFITNRAEEGGAISNYETSSGTAEAIIYNSLFDRNETTGKGGAIYSDQAPLTIVDSTFTGNKATNNPGGAIYSLNSTLTVINSTFKANEAFVGGAINDRYLGGSPTTATISDSTFGGDLASDGNKASMGGALVNESTPMRINNSIFNHNSATNNGGAIFNSAAVLTLQNSKFLNNSATTEGGAIYNNVGTLNIISSNDNTIFSNNTTGISSSSTPNDIYLAYGSTLNLNSSYGNIIYLGGGIKTLQSTNAININPTGILQYDGVTNAPTVGEVILNGAISGTTAAVHPNVNLHSGILTLNNDSYLNDSDLSLTYGRLNMINNTVGVMDLNSLKVNNFSNLAIDADLANEVSDRITAKTASTVAGKTLTVSSINLLSDSKTTSTKTQLIDSSIANNVAVTLGATKAYTPIYAYDISYDNSTGKLAFAGGPGGGGGGGNFNPAVIATPVAAQSGAFANQVNSYNQSFQNMDYTMLMPRAQRLAMKYANRYAMLEGGADKTKLQGAVYEDKNAGTWFQPYTSFENISFNNGPKINNVSYGSFFGGDSKMIELKKGWDVVYSGYAGYNGSHQTYSGNSIYQNGGQLGTGATFYKGNSFTGITANVGASAGEASTMYGNDNFNMLSTGLAAKTGYNFEFKEGKFIIQPSYMMSYTFVNTFDYTNAAGVKITSDPLNAIQIAPGIKFIANTKNGWQPYLGAEMFWNLMDKAKYYANDVSLPELSIKPYFQYGLGVQKRVGERITGFGQAMVRNGGRTGIALAFGFRMSVGKDPAKL